MATPAWQPRLNWMTYMAAPAPRMSAPEHSEVSLAVEAVTAHPDSGGRVAHLSRAGVTMSHCGGAGRVEDFAVTTSEKTSSARGIVLKFYPLLFQNHLPKMTQLGEEF